MYLMADGLTRIAAPILSFTADELWRYLPGREEESVHMALFPAASELSALVNDEVLGRWEQDASGMKYSYDFWYQPRQNVMVSSEWAAPKTTRPGFKLELRRYAG